MKYETYSEYKERVTKAKEKLLSLNNNLNYRLLLRRAPNVAEVNYDSGHDKITFIFEDSPNKISYSIVPKLWVISDLSGKTIGVYIEDISKKEKEDLDYYIKELKDVVTEEQLSYIKDKLE